MPLSWVMMGCVAAVVLVACADAAPPSVSSLFSPASLSDADVYVAPKVFNHTLAGPVGPSGSRPHWMVAQWNIPSQLPLQAKVPPEQCGISAEWSAANPDARVCYNATARQVELAQDGARVACGKEFDLFVSPVGSNYPGFPVGMTPSRPLSQLTALNLTFTAALTYADVTPRCGSQPQCGGSGAVDYGYATAAVTFDSVAGPHQTLFYQVDLYDTRRHSAGCAIDDCKPRRNWFFSSNPFGVGDSVGSFGSPCLSSVAPSAHAYNLNILPLVADAIMRPPSPSFNTSLSAWRATGFYIGLGLQGSVTHTLQLSLLDLVQTL